ncbi:MAG: energy transducer TonB, partial [Terracidiphilus sp.]
MFEDSTFESTGRIRTRSRGWMIAAFAFNGSILLAIVLIPLLYPEALPRMTYISLLLAPPPRPTPPPPQQPVHLTHVSSEMMGRQLIAPRLIPTSPLAPSSPEPLVPNTVAGWDNSSA